MTFSYTEFMQLLGLYFWPFVRLSGLLLMVPLFSGTYVSMRIRLFLAVFITLAVAPSLTLPPPIDPFTWHGILLIMQQLGIGVAIGLIFTVVFQAFVIAGHLASMAMGLAMASMVDPATGVNTPIIGRYFTIIATLLFLLMNGHVLVFKAIVQSFETLPIGLHFFTQDSLKLIFNFGAQMFESGVAIALPLVTALLLVNISFGVIARAAPALNIFAVGFPVTLLVGLIMLLFITPLVLPNLVLLMNTLVELLSKLELTT
ncbi:MAG: flagellar biosynthetic protein FliR [Piscirickettsiaceae bacterium CG_4_9_14_3_um_filter_43_564]|nr:flagellar biosynthetic protein FliR [Thiomicrospira sp.]OIP94982.1 MAG: flagellar biosynthetic protein FliR [Thiomicrospira sp. CG2_30_44_34]PIQ04955.1 MAG: flagellar biosynthetic protein FliR [Piscirickettsiaceae bacterium CG18_big_fil_WC_8_21_14_2_50_44_103]PIU38230.1 MAG: flagellar biosynthetic protein FliR [Piscirickettsiaceae bacterium CG07_land_8_20_14_0_80_44_28]PIW57320.1 MAG: flagellar biosynthetic protein FliR [Piscirickettsiaceae bacterium CG12_big_fil_rev_8_21_14_0_65_44_934]PIW